MIIKKKRIQSLKILNQVTNDEIIIGVPLDEISEDKLKKIGFTEQLNIGETVLPSKLGPVSRRNSDGYNIIHRDEEKETCYRTIYWSWEYKNNGITVEDSDFKDVPYKRYPRTFVPPMSIEISIIEGESGKKFIVVPKLRMNQTEKEDEIKHVINLFLELFGFCHILENNLKEINFPKLVRLNWEILPKGELPWEQRYEQVKPFIQKARNKNQIVVKDRIEKINSHKPDFAAIGINGFNGYIVFGFSLKQLYIFESINTNNATYVFDSKWKDVTLLSKKEILTASLQKMRIIHRVDSWEKEIANLLK